MAGREFDILDEECFAGNIWEPLKLLEASEGGKSLFRIALLESSKMLKLKRPHALTYSVVVITWFSDFMELYVCGYGLVLGIGQLKTTFYMETFTTLDVFFPIEIICWFNY